MRIPFEKISQAKIKTRASTKTRVVITNTSLAFSFTLLIKGVKNAANSGSAITRIGEWVIKVSSLLSFYFHLTLRFSFMIGTTVPTTTMTPIRM